MKRRILAMALATALALSLTACGGGNTSSNPGGSSSQPDISGDIPVYDGSNIEVSLTLNQTEVTLNKAGATFQLRYTVSPSFETTPVYSSSDESVATVNDQGKITAVASGTAVITVEHPSVTDVATGKYLSAACTVTCDWKDSQPAPAPDASKPEAAPPDTALQVDLQDFYTATTGKYEFGMLALADNDILDALYAGLTGIGLEQMQVYYCPMSMNNGEFCLVQVKNSKDVDTVKAIFQARVDYMVGDGNGPGGAQYPMAMDSWENNSRIVSNGNYVMMVVHENADDIVKEFNALF